MKRMINCVFTLLLIVACLFILTITIFAESSENSEDVSDIKITPMLQSETEIENMINDKLTDELVEERIGVFKKRFLPTVENFSVDKSLYIVKYCVGNDYWDSLESLDYDCLVEAFSDYLPKVIVPVLGDVKDSTGNVSRRVVGHFQLAYNWFRKDYTVSDSIYVGVIDNTNTDVIGYHASIAYYLNENKVSAEKALIIKYPSSLTDYMDEIIVVKTETDTVVLDIGDTLQTATEHPRRNVSVYSISEYVPLRKEIEKEMNKSSNVFISNPAGGNVSSAENNVNSVIKIALNNLLPYFIGIIAISVAVVIIVVTKKRRKRIKNKLTD